MSDNVKGTPPSPLPAGAAERKSIPLATGCYDYFPAALAAVAEVSFIGNEKHNPGEPLHHARGKSSDHPDAMQRHFLERGGFDTITLPDGRTFRVRHSAEMVWRGLAILQEELEAAGAPLARGATVLDAPSAHCEFCPGVGVPHGPHEDPSDPRDCTLIDPCLCSDCQRARRGGTVE